MAGIFGEQGALEGIAEDEVEEEKRESRERRESEDPVLIILRAVTQ